MMSPMSAATAAVVRHCAPGGLPADPLSPPAGRFPPALHCCRRRTSSVSRLTVRQPPLPSDSGEMSSVARNLSWQRNMFGSVIMYGSHMSDSY